MRIDAMLPTPPWRRPLLVATGLLLAATAVPLNNDRLGWRLVPTFPVFEEEDHLAVDEIEVESRTVAFFFDAGTRHQGEEGRMGKPTSKNKSGLYAMKGPKDAVPPVADQAVGGAAPEAQIGEAFGVGGLGLVGTGRGGGGMGESVGERYAHVEANPLVESTIDPRSTFSIDVDTASYANARRHLRNGSLPPVDAVRTEEFVNYFGYDYPAPAGAAPFSVTTEVGPAPWDPRRRLVHIGLQGKAARDGLPTRNLVFLIDVSGSMDSEDKLPLVRQGLAALTEQLGERDRIAIVVYAGAAGAVLPPTAGDEKEAILAALHGLESGGSTNGAEGIELAYDLAERHFVDGGVNRVILATDGDFNVGVSSDEELERLIERKRESGVFLSVLGVGTGNLNDRMMEQLADKGNGNYAYLDGPLEARKVLVEEASATLDAIAKDVKVQVAFDPALVKAHRLVGYENRKLAHRDFDDDRKDAGEIGAGHSVTALYEIVPTSALENDASFMTLDLRWKEPDANTSTKLSFTVRDFGHGLDDTSDDFRFSAAVAAFAQKLRSAEPEAKMTYSDVLALAGTALGEDPDCYRRELLELVWLAASHAGEQLERPDVRGCEPDPLPPAPAVTPAHAASRPAPDPSWDWGAFALEVLRLLPPLLALPLFVLAFRRPRRRR